MASQFVVSIGKYSPIIIEAISYLYSNIPLKKHQILKRVYTVTPNPMISNLNINLSLNLNIPWAGGESLQVQGQNVGETLVMEGPLSLHMAQTRVTEILVVIPQSFHFSEGKHQLPQARVTIYNHYTMSYYISKILKHIS